MPTPAEIIERSLERLLDAVEAAIEREYGALAEVVATSPTHVLFLDEVGDAYIAKYEASGAEVTLKDVEPVPPELEAEIEWPEPGSSVEEVVDALLSGEDEAAERALDDLLARSVGQSVPERIAAEVESVMSPTAPWRRDRSQVERLAESAVGEGFIPLDPDEVGDPDPVATLALMASLGELAEQRDIDGALVRALKVACRGLSRLIESGETELAERASVACLRAVPEIELVMGGEL